MSWDSKTETKPEPQWSKVFQSNRFHLRRYLKLNPAARRGNKTVKPVHRIRKVGTGPAGPSEKAIARKEALLRSVGVSDDG